MKEQWYTSRRIGERYSEFKVLVEQRQGNATTTNGDDDYDSQYAAEAAEAAAAQDKFWQMHDYLFRHQKALDEYLSASFIHKLYFLLHMMFVN